MSYHTPTVGTRAPAAHAGAPTTEMLATFGSGLDRLLARDGDDEAALNTVLAFYDSRCDRASDLRALGDAMFDALNRSDPRTAIAGRYRECHVFSRVGDRVLLQLEGEDIAQLPLNEAIRLATLLHGAPQTGRGTLQAA